MKKGQNVILVLIVILAIFYIMTVNSKSDIFGPIEQFIIQDSQQTVYIKCYEISTKYRLAVVLPFEWYLINANNTILFPIPNGVGKSCKIGQSPAAIYNNISSLKRNYTKLVCTAPNVSKLKQLIINLPYEEINYSIEMEDNDIPAEKDNQIKNVIKFLLQEGLFTFTKQN